MNQVAETHKSTTNFKIYFQRIRYLLDQLFVLSLTALSYKQNKQLMINESIKYPGANCVDLLTCIYVHVYQRHGPSTSCEPTPKHLLANHNVVGGSRSYQQVLYG